MLSKKGKKNWFVCKWIGDYDFRLRFFNFCSKNNDYSNDLI